MYLLQRLIDTQGYFNITATYKDFFLSSLKQKKPHKQLRMNLVLDFSCLLYTTWKDQTMGVGGSACLRGTNPMKICAENLGPPPSS